MTESAIDIFLLEAPTHVSKFVDIGKNIVFAKMTSLLTLSWSKKLSSFF